MPQVEKNAYELIAALKPLVASVRGRDKALADQLVRAASSVALNVAEAAYSDAGNRRARYFTAAGSANETRAALRAAVGWSYFAAPEAAAALALLDGILAMLWRLTRR